MVDYSSVMGKLLVRERFVVIVTSYVPPSGWRDKNAETSAFLSRPKEKGRRGLTFQTALHCACMCLREGVRESERPSVCVFGGVCSLNWVFHGANSHYKIKCLVTRDE